jgi:hypothetical protein
MYINSKTLKIHKHSHKMQFKSELEFPAVFTAGIRAKTAKNTSDRILSGYN